jgi:TonB family protein
MRKLIISVRYLMAFLIVLTFSNALLAQFAKYSVPARWELYSVKDKNVSFLMPRLPVLNEQNNECRAELIREYAAYNDGVVYVLRITSETEPGAYCSQKGKFDENKFSERVNTLKSELKDESNSENNFSGNSIIKLAGYKRVIKLVNDYDNKRWFELSIHGADEKKIEVKNFLDSLKIDKAAPGIEIGPGASQTFGDDVSKSIVEVKDNNAGNDESAENSKKIAVKIESEASYLARIIIRPKAKYTDAARKNQVTGTVRLKVAFLANGAIGDIAVIVSLPFGLTEEAIAAARKMVFIPQQGFKTRYSVSKTVEYSFNIY